MATVGIPRAGGYADYSSGGQAGFIPELWSTKLTTKFYNTTVFGEIANTDYEGEIARMGDVVHIRRTPDISVNPYQVGMTINYQVPDVQATELVIDQGLYWAYQIDNVDRYQSDIDLMDDFTQDAVQKTMEQQDQTLLATIPGEVDAANQGASAGAESGDVNLGTVGAPLSVTSGNVIDNVLLAAGQVLDEAKVPRDGKRWIVLPSWLIRKMKNSELKYAYETGDAVSPLRNGRVGRTDDFIIYQSNNIKGVSNAGVKSYACPFGHPAGLTWASQFIDTDAVKLVNQIGTGVYSVCAYGFKVTEPSYLGSVYATPGVG
jgi:hypothetical protein